MRSSRILFAVACLTLVALATSANAATILQYGQVNSNDIAFTLSTSGGTTSLVSGPTPGTATPVPITVTQVGTQSGVSLPAFETFTFTSTTAPSGGTQGGFNGVLTITTNPPPAPPGVPTFFTATVTGGQVNTTSGFAFNAGTGPGTGSVLYTNLSPFISQQVGGATQFLGSLSLTSSSFTTSGGVTQGQLNGNFAPGVPEPASLVSGGLAAIAGLGCFGWRRFKASRA